MSVIIAMVPIMPISKKADSRNLGSVSLGEVFAVFGKVVTNQYVIIATVGVVLFFNFVSYVQHYRKKPPKVRTVRTTAPAPEKKPEENAGGENGGDSE